MKVRREGNRSIIMKVIMGLTRVAISYMHKECAARTYEYHSHAEYSVFSRRERVLSPEWVVFDTAIICDNCT